MSTARRGNRRRTLYRIGAGLIVILVVLQFGRFVVPAFEVDNPDVTHSVNWDSEHTEALWNAACADCHSNETDWPWYSYVAPVTFLVAYEANEGRDILNVSEETDIKVNEVVESIEEEEMPPSTYTFIHSDAHLDDTEKEDLINGIVATFSSTESEEPSEEGESDEEA